MSSKRLRRSSYPRPRGRRPWGLLGLLLGLLTLGLATALLAGGRRSFSSEEGLRRRRRRSAPEPEALADEGSEPSEPPEVEGEALWIAGPAGNIYVRDGGGSAGDPGRGPLPVLFVHSLAGNGGQWALQLDHLRRHRRAVALDLRGHGESDPAEDGDYSVPGLAADVAAVADELGLRRFLLVGHSLGSLAAIEYAGRHPERVAGLLLVDPNGDMSRVPEEEFRPFLESLRSDPLAELDSYFRQLVVGGDPDAAGWVLEDLRLTHEDAVASAVEGSLRYTPLPALDRYPGPKLSVISEMNRLPTSLHKLRPDLPTRLMTGTGHWVMMDRPEDFNHVLDEFLGEVEGRV